LKKSRGGKKPFTYEDGSLIGSEVMTSLQTPEPVSSAGAKPKGQPVKKKTTLAEKQLGNDGRKMNTSF